MQLDFGINAGFVEELYAKYLDNPEAVEPVWRKFFDDRVGRVGPDGAASGPIPQRTARATRQDGAAVRVQPPPPPSIEHIIPENEPGNGHAAPPSHVQEVA